MNLKLHNQSNNQKIATVEKGKLNALVFEGNCMQSKSAVTTEVESYSCRTCIHPQGSLQKSLNNLPTQESIDLHEKLRKLYDL